MTRKERYQALVDHFSVAMAEPTTELCYDSPFQLLVAVVLSAQCTDKRVNKVTPALFEAFPTAKAMSEASYDVLYPFIQTISYPRSKAKYLSGLAGIIATQYVGQLPTTREGLEQLPGVGRKTANVIMATFYDRPVIAVDTHVMRVSKRLGLVDGSAKTPLAIERALYKHMPLAYRSRANHWLVLHGRYVCRAPIPRCGACPFRGWCPFHLKR